MKLIRGYEIRYRSGWVVRRIYGTLHEAALEWHRQYYFTEFPIFLFEIDVLGDERDITPGKG